MKSFLEFDQQITEEVLDEVLSKDAKAGEWIDDFVKSDNPKFAGKSKEKRKEMALAAYYAKQRNEEAELDEEGLKDACWKGYEAIGTKKKNGKEVPNCVPVKESMDKMFKHVHKDVSDPKLAHKQAMDVVKNNQGKVRHISDTHSEVDFPGGKSAVFKTSKEGDKVVTHIAHHNTYSEEVEIEESRGHSIIASKLAQMASRSSEQGKSPAQIRAEKEKEEKQKQSKLGEGMISYSEFMAKLEESRIDDLRDKQAAEKEAKKDAYEAGEKAKPVSPKRAVKGHSYGADDDAEGDDDETKKVVKPDAEKRGRGRPAGSKSGARR